MCIFAQPVQQLLKFDKTTHDFGQVLISKGPVSCTFTATNVSGKELCIMSVTTSCGCTNVKYDREPIAPGKTFKLSATYTNDEGPYPFDKTITVKIQGVQKPVLLHLRGISQNEIKPDKEIYTNVFGGVLGLETTEFKCGNLEQGNSRGDQITVANLSSKPVKLTFENVSEGLSLDVKPNPIPGGAKATIYYTINTRPDKWGYNMYYATIVLGGKSSNKSFGIKAFTAENFTSCTKEDKVKGSRPIFDESTYSFGHKKQGEKFKATFKCTNKGQAKLVMHKVDSDYEFAVPGRFPELEAGKNCTFTVDVDTSRMPKGEGLVIITLTTNSPMRPIVTLFIAGIID